MSLSDFCISKKRIDDSWVRSIYSPGYQQFLQRLRQARQEAGLSQIEAAEALGKPQSYISYCETGGRRVDVEELRLFAKLYKKPTSFFLGE
jgi:transcriptional regulator with XRE-family HTH domain